MKSDKDSPERVDAEEPTVGRTGSGSALTRSSVIDPRQREMPLLQAASLQAASLQAQARQAQRALQSIVTAARETSAREAALLSASRVAPFSRAALQRAEQAIANAMAPYAEQVAMAQRTFSRVAQIHQQNEAMVKAFRRDVRVSGEALRLWKPPFDFEVMLAPGRPLLRLGFVVEPFPRMPRRRRGVWDKAGPLVPQEGVPAPYDDGQAPCPVCARVSVAFAFDPWCPGCGTDIFLPRVRYELTMARQMEASPRWAFVRAVQSLERALERLYWWATYTRWGPTEADARTSRQGMVWGNLPKVAEILRKEFGADVRDVVEAPGVLRLRPTRNVILHKGGVIDEKALRRAPDIGRLGGDLKVTPEEVAESIDAIQRVIEGVYARLFRT